MYYKDITLIGPQTAIGYEDENLPTRVIIDISDLTKYGTGTTVLEVKRPCDREAYIAEQTEVDGNNFYWYPTKGDLEVSGLLKCQVKAVIGDQIVKTRVYFVQVSGALNGDGTLSGVVPDALQTFVESASGSETAAKASAEEAKKAEEAAKDYRDAAASSASAASESASSASSSKTAAASSAEAANSSETAAATSASAASKSATDAAASQKAAADSASAASASQTAAAKSETNAASSQKAAASSASDSADSAAAAKNYRDAAKASETAAVKSASDAATSESNAKTYASNASDSANTASSKASQAGTYATNASNSAMSAASSAASIKASADQIAANKKALQTPTTVTDPTSKTVLLAGSQGIDYSKLADAIIAKYQGQTLAGKAQSVKSALDTFASNILDINNYLDNNVQMALKQGFQMVQANSDAIATKMTTKTYDADGDGMVDNAAKVNGHSVESDVPADAAFTDTVYDDTALTEKLQNYGLKEQLLRDLPHGNWNVPKWVKLFTFNEIGTRVRQYATLFYTNDNYGDAQYLKLASIIGYSSTSPVCLTRDLANATTVSDDLGYAVNSDGKTEVYMLLKYYAVPSVGFLIAYNVTIDCQTLVYDEPEGIKYF